MSTLLRVPSAAGDILVEVSEPVATPAITEMAEPPRAHGPIEVYRGRARAGGGAQGERAEERAASNFEQSWARIRPAALAIVEQLGNATEGVDEVVVKFGVKFSAGAGAFIAAASTEATFNVEIKWKRHSS